MVACPLPLWDLSASRKFPSFSFIGPTCAGTAVGTVVGVVVGGIEVGVGTGVLVGAGTGVGVAAGAGVEAASDFAVTRITTCIVAGCTLQKYRKTPTSLKVKEKPLP